MFKCVNLTCSPVCMGPGTLTHTHKKLRVGAFFRVGRVTPIQQFFLGLILGILLLSEHWVNENHDACVVNIFYVITFSLVLIQLLCKDPMQRLQSLSELKKHSFYQDTNFEQLLRRGLKPKTFLKRKLPRTMPRKGCSRKTFFQDKIPRDLTVSTK